MKKKCSYSDFDYRIYKTSERWHDRCIENINEFISPREISFVHQDEDTFKNMVMATVILISNSKYGGLFEINDKEVSAECFANYSFKDESVGIKSEFMNMNTLYISGEIVEKIKNIPECPDIYIVFLIAGMFLGAVKEVIAIRDNDNKKGDDNEK